MKGGFRRLEFLRDRLSSNASIIQIRGPVLDAGTSRFSEFYRGRFEYFWLSCISRGLFSAVGNTLLTVHHFQLAGVSWKALLERSRLRAWCLASDVALVCDAT